MDDGIVKICVNCGPLMADQVRFRKTRKEIICKACESKRQREARLKYPAKFKERGNKSRHIERNPDLKELKCSKCQNIKSVDAFNKHMLNIRYPYCRECRILATKVHHERDESKKKHKKWYQDKYEPIERNARYLKTYGITLKQFEAMTEQQNGLCLICKKPEVAVKRKDGKVYLSVDHCHATGRVRGLLCSKCNTGIGSFLESKEILRSAISYLENH